MKNSDKLPHLTATKSGGYALHVTMPAEKGPAVSKAIINGVKASKTAKYKSQFVVEATVEHSGETVAARQLALISSICDDFSSPDHALYPHNNQLVKLIRMASTDCPTTTSTEFTGELSQEYIARYGDE